MDLREFRSLYPFSPWGIYPFGEAVSYPWEEEDGGVWINARSITGDPTSMRKVPLNLIAIQQNTR